MIRGAAVPTVMVVDDVEGVRKVVAMQLRVMGYKVLEAAGGGEAVELAERERPSLVLIDVSMPGMDGLEAARRIRLVGGMAEAPIIALSALFGDDEIRGRALASGCDDFVTKPLEFNDLSALIRRHLGPG